MTVAIIILAGVLAAAIGGLITAGIKLYGAIVALQPERARTATAIVERNAAVVTAGELSAENETLTRRLRELELAHNRKTTEAADAAAEKVRTAPDSTSALDELNRVFAEALLSADDPATPGGADREGAAVRTTTAVGDAAGAERRP